MGVVLAQVVEPALVHDEDPAGNDGSPARGGGGEGGGDQDGFSSRQSDIYLVECKTLHVTLIPQNALNPPPKTNTYCS